MALVNCRECGQAVSDQAETCPHCGIKSPGQPNGATPQTSQQPPAALPQKKGNGCLTVIGIFFVIFVVIVVITAIGSNSGNKSSSDGGPGPAPSTSASSPSASASNSGDNSTSETPVFVGNRGQIIGPTFGCQNLDDIKTFMDSYTKSQIAKDNVGEHDAVMTAIEAGCGHFGPGVQGLVVDTSGFLEGYDRIRMDSDDIAYWVPRETVGPIPGQPNNP